MIEIHPLTAAMVDSADQLLMQAFGKPEPRISDLLRALELQPDGYYLAYENDELAGMGGALDYGEFAYVGLVAVHPCHQRRGVARRLMDHLLAWLDARQTPGVLLDASAMGYHLYQALGFVDVEDAAVYQQPEPVVTPPPPAFVRPMLPEDLPDVAEFDRPIFGADRSALLALLLRDFTQSAWLVHTDEGAVSGYLFAKGRRLGPWVASRPADADALLQAALTARLPGIPTLVAPASNRQSHGLLLRYGFRRLSACRHMRRGRPPLAERRDLVYAQTSFAIG